MNKKKLALIIIASIGVGLLIAILATDKIVETGHAEFCGSCHEMQGMVKAFDDDVHGGNNKIGFVAECTDCHLPHNSTMGFLIAKGFAGAKDGWSNATKDMSKFDWTENRKHRTKFVYDSGCLKCHVKLKEKTSANPKALLAHKSYFNQSTKLNCVSCHQHVGHKNLLLHISSEEKK